MYAIGTIYGKPKRKAPMWLGALVAVLALCAAGAVILAVVGDTQGDAPDPVSADRAIDAQIMCERFVEKQLKSPASAEFRPERTTKDGAKYTVIGTVDSQNSFGAMLRSDYVCTVRDEGTGTWTLIALELD